MKIQSAEYVISAVEFEGCPASDLPEFAFIGRSNVGKSSLINFLTRANALARVSATPGRTRELTFFEINRKWGLVDLPGYGFAKGSERDRDRFMHLITSYLTERENLMCAFVLIDSRHPPQKSDIEFARWGYDHQVPCVFVFTKVDKAKPRVVKENMELFKQELRQFCTDLPRFFESSVETGAGRGEILNFIDQAIRRAPAPGVANRRP